MPTLPLPRTSLASLRCPSTPFLAPRLLRTPAYIAFLPARCATPLAGLQRASYAKEARSQPRGQFKIRAVYINKSTNKSRNQRHPSAPVPPEATPALKSLRAACDVVSVRTLLELYPGLVATKALHRNDTRRIAQALHARVRNMRDADVSLDDIFIFVQRVVSDIRTGAIPPHPYAHVHLLGVHKECQRYQDGYAFWQWLVDQDDMHVSQAVYGAAIELAAYGNILALDELEDLYADALKRFPGVFAEYHLSPEAIVPDRNQPVAMTNVPVLLLQGILTARILAGDWRNAYLALDTALRLFPAQVPTRYFELFMTTRPLPEAYTAFLVACRAGVLFKPSHLTGLIKRLCTSRTNTSLQARVTGLRAIANAMYAYVEAGGSLQPPHISVFIRAFDFMGPTTNGRLEFPVDEEKVRTLMITAAHEFTSTLTQAGLPPHIHIFTALIHLAGKYKVPSLLHACIQDIQTAQLELQAADFRTILDAAGWLGDRDLIDKYWTRIASDAEAKGERPDHDDWVTLVRACNRHGHGDYFKEQLWKYEHALSAALKLRLTYCAETVEPTSRAMTLDMDHASFVTEIDALRSQVKNTAAVVMSGQRLDLRNTPFYMSIDSTRPPLGLPEDLRTVYDELTTDPHQPAPPSGTTTPTLSPTGIPLDELRFQNWVSVLEMMTLAKLHDPGDKDAAFGGDVPGGLPLRLDALREMIRDLRTVAYGSREPKIQYRPVPILSKDLVVDSKSSSSDGPITDDKGPRIRGFSTWKEPSSSDLTAPKKVVRKPKTKNTLGILRGGEVGRRAEPAQTNAGESGQGVSTQDTNSSAS